jgi:hypothetical protein
MYNGLVELHDFNKKDGDARCGEDVVIYQHVFFHPSSSEASVSIPDIRIPASLFFGCRKQHFGTCLAHQRQAETAAP